MAHAYRAVGWNRQKRLYDLTLLLGVLLFLGLFVGVGAAVQPELTAETLVLRGLGSAAFLLLHVALCIGPLCRLDARFLPLLYNRRHLGVATFGLGLGHGGLALFQFHALGDVDPLTSLFTSNTEYGSLAQFPFQTLGFAALAVLFLMAATSHDFWLRNLGPATWKGLHMAVYGAYALLVGHVLLGELQTERSPLLAALVLAGVVLVVGLHALAAWREAPGDVELETPPGAEFVDVGPADTLPDGRARVVCLSGERVAVYRHGDRLSAVSAVCRHQNGPLGEGRVIDGCITCPWHGYQYLPESGASPPPFEEAVPTFRVRVHDGRVWVDPVPNPAGTPVEPARLAGGSP